MLVNTTALNSGLCTAHKSVQLPTVTTHIASHTARLNRLPIWYLMQACGRMPRLESWFQRYTSNQ